MACRMFGVKLLFEAMLVYWWDKLSEILIKIQQFKKMRAKCRLEKFGHISSASMYWYITHLILVLLVSLGSIFKNPLHEVMMMATILLFGHVEDIWSFVISVYKEKLYVVCKLSSPYEWNPI